MAGAIGALKGPWHGGAPSEVVDQLHEIGSVDQAEAWIRATLARGERLMGFGHRVYRAYDPRAAALRSVAEGMAGVADWLDKAVAVEEIALRVLAEHKPDYPIKTNVEYYAAAVLQGVGLPPNLFPATFALARHAGWTAHCLEQADGQRPHPPRRPLRRPGRAPPARLTLRAQPPRRSARSRCSAGLSVSSRARRSAARASSDAIQAPQHLGPGGVEEVVRVEPLARAARAPPGRPPGRRARRAPGPG